jgi:hypothetical protein
MYNWGGCASKGADDWRRPKVTDVLLLLGLQCVCTSRRRTKTVTFARGSWLRLAKERM